MTKFSVFLIALMSAVPVWPAAADEVVTDYTGKQVRLQEGDVKSPNGINIHYYTVGEGPLVFISHGHTAFWFDWRNQISALSEKYKVVIYDLRNHNKSGFITGLDNNRNSELGEDLLALQNHFTRESAIHIGHDMGGMVLWDYAMDHPEKVKQLIIENAIHPRAFTRELAKNAEQAKASVYIRAMQSDPAEAAKNARANFSPDNPRRASELPEFKKLWADAYGRMSDAHFRGNIDWYSVNFPKEPYRVDAVGFGRRDQEFPQVKAPTLVIHTLDDAFLRPGALDGLGLWIDNRFTLVTLPKGGHNVHIESPRVINDIILDWLN